MSVLRSRTMPLIVPGILFVSFLFATFPLGQGLKCKSCISIHNKNCTDHPELVESVECGPLISTTTQATDTTQATNTTQATDTTQATNTTQTTELDNTTSSSVPPSNNSYGSPLNEFLEVEAYADGNDYICYYGSGKMKGETDTVVVRGCAQKNEINCEKIKQDAEIQDAVCWTCESDNCNPANGIQVGVISLFTPLIAYLLLTR